MRIGIDAMGGDLAPAEQVAGAIAAREFIDGDDRVALYGLSDAIEPLLADTPGWQDWIDIVHCSQQVGMEDVPVEAVRSKPDNPLVRMARDQREGKLSAMISAGNTGACVAACQMHLRRLPGVHRPGIAVIVPTLHGPVMVCDVGANVNCRPQHLHQYAIMSLVYGQRVAGLKRGRVGLLSIGEEDAKGNQLVKQTRELLREDESIDFHGNVEGRDLFRGTCDVIVTEGFVGNVCLKLMEGMAEGLFRSLAEQLMTQGDAGKLAVATLKSAHDKYDYTEYGGAPLLGVNGVCIICHGSSNSRAIANAVRVAREFAAQGVNEQITTLLGECSRVMDG